MWDQNGSTSGPTAYHLDDDDDNDDDNLQVWWYYEAAFNNNLYFWSKQVISEVSVLKNKKWL